MSLPPSPHGHSRACAEATTPSASQARERILVIRLSAMGDIIHAMPAIAALRAARPELQLGWVVEERWAELLCARKREYTATRSPFKPLVDWVHIANFKIWRTALAAGQTWREMGSLRSEVQQIKYDVALDLQGAIRSALVASVVGVKTRLGSSHPREAPASVFYTRQITSRAAHVVDHALSIASAVAGQELHYVAPPFPIDPGAEEWADHLRGSLGSKPMAILNPGAGWGAKCWPAVSYGIVAQGLGDRGMSVIVNHGPGEELLANTVRESSGNAAIPVSCSIGELIALTRRASLFIGGDTGPMHLAAALRIPVVALFGPTRPDRNGPYGTKSIVLRNPESLYNTTHSDRPDEGLILIEPRAVINAADRLLGESRG